MITTKKGLPETIRRLKMKSKEIVSLVVWMCMGWIVSELVIATGWFSAGTVRAAAAGAFGCFLVLTMIGSWRQAQWARQEAQARVQFEKDLKAEQEQQADIDRKIIDKLRNEHELSGTEQDRRLKALEAALKHLKRK
jgi:hypothetical protein